MKNVKMKLIFRKFIPYLFLIPLFLLLGIFKFYPTVSAIFRSLYEWNGGTQMKFIGIDNYVRMLQDEIFGKSLINLLIISVASILKVVTIPLFVAELVVRVKNKKMADMYKYIYIIPMVIPGMVLILLWQWIYDFNGLLNGFLTAVGLGDLSTAWLGNESTALGAIIGYNFPWIAGIQFLIFLSGLQSIPQSLYEAADLEGANAFQRLFYIDIPLLAGQFRYLLITTLTTSFQAFEYVLVLTNGGPGTATMVPALYLYQESFSYFRMGYACALGTALFVVIMILTVLNMKFIRSADSE